MVLGYTFEPSHVPIFLTLILLEGVLSFDNAAVLAAMVRRLPEGQRSRALSYGLAGAYGFRVLAVLGASFLIRYPVLRVVGGAYLVYLAAKHLFGAKPHEEHVERGLFDRLGLSPFWSLVSALLLADVAFALDQVIVAVAFTDELVLIVAASLIGIVFLRLSASFIGRLMVWFPALEKLAYVAVGFVGLKLAGVQIVRWAGYPDFAVSKVVSVGVTVSLLVLPVLGKVIWDRLGPSPAA